MNDVSSLATNQLVTVVVKTNIVDAPESVKNRWKSVNKQDCIVANSSGNGRVVLCTSLHYGVHDMGYH